MQGQPRLCGETLSQIKINLKIKQERKMRILCRTQVENKEDQCSAPVELAVMNMFQG